MVRDGVGAAVVRSIGADLVGSRNPDDRDGGGGGAPSTFRIASRKTASRSAPGSIAHRRGITPRFVVAALVVGALVADPAPCGTPAIAVVKSTGVAQFDIALEAAAERLEHHPLQPHILTLDLAGNEANVPPVMDALRAASPAVIVTVGSLATSVVLREVPNTPVVFSMVLYPELSTGGTRDRVTGASLDIPPEVQFRYLRRLLPNARRVGVLFHPQETGAVVRAAAAAATRERFELVARSVRDPGAALGALQLLMEEVDAVWTVADTHVLTAETVPALILAAMRRRVPLIGLSPAHVRAGALAALSCDYADIGVQTAELAARILDGAKPSALPIMAPRHAAITINAKTAAHLGLNLAPDLALEAKAPTP